MCGQTQRRLVTNKVGEFQMSACVATLIKKKLQYCEALFVSHESTYNTYRMANRVLCIVHKINKSLEDKITSKLTSVRYLGVQLSGLVNNFVGCADKGAVNRMKLWLTKRISAVKKQVGLSF